MPQVTRRALSTLTALVMVGTLFLGAPAPVRAAVYYWVSQYGSAGSGTGCTDADFVGFDETPIAAAVAAASNGDTIRICSGTYVIANTIDLAGKTITLDPADPDAAPTVLDGGGTTQILTSSGAITVSNLTFKDGYSVFGGAIAAGTSATVTNSRFISNDATSDGGAIYADTSATVTNSRFISNDATSDGGAIAAGTSATVTDSTFTGNTADFGGAIVTTSATVTDSTFTGNIGAVGGAIAAGTSATVTDSTFTGNTAAGFGGGAIAADTATVTGSTFTNNSANAGGAIYAETSVTVTDSRFTSNDAASVGGAIYADTATVTNSRFTSNDATYDGGAILATTGTIARSRFIRNTAGGHGGAVHLWAPNSDNLQQLRRNTFTRNRAGAGGAIVLGSCGPVDPGAAKAARVERANRFSGNRATEQRRTNNIETGYCGD